MKKNGKLKINYHFIIIFLIVIFKYFKMQGILSDIVINSFLIVLVFIIGIVIIKKRYIRNINKNGFICCIFFTALQMFFLQDVDIAILTATALIFSEDDQPIQHIIKYYCISLTIVFLGTVIANKMGYLQYKTISRLLNGNIIQRNSLGFKHPNEAYAYFLFIVISLSYFMKSKFKYTCIVGILSYIVYILTLSRTGLICAILFITLMWLYNKKLKINKYMFFIATIFTFMLAIKYGKDNNLVNEILSYRPQIYYYYISSNSIYNIIGNALVRGVTLDNEFLSIIIGSGWIFYIFYFAVFFYSGKLIERDRKLSLIFIITIVYGCIETHSINIGLNCILLIQIYAIITKRNQLKE